MTATYIEHIDVPGKENDKSKKKQNNAKLKNTKYFQVLYLY